MLTVAVTNYASLYETMSWELSPTNVNIIQNTAYNFQISGVRT